jgi:hypothetical protein
MDLVRADDQVGADGAVASEPVKVRDPSVLTPVTLAASRQSITGLSATACNRTS